MHMMPCDVIWYTTVGPWHHVLFCCDTPAVRPAGGRRTAVLLTAGGPPVNKPKLCVCFCLGARAGERRSGVA